MKKGKRHKNTKVRKDTGESERGGREAIQRSKHRSKFKSTPPVCFDRATVLRKGNADLYNRGGIIGRDSAKRVTWD